MFGSLLCAATECAGALLMLDALFWLHAAITGKVLDGIDPKHPGQVVCLNPPLPAVLLQTAVAAGLLIFSFKLYQSHVVDRIYSKRELGRKLRARAQLSAWD